jgi:adenosylmethionine-8-amino-7-oxononanoate aminotransferase
MTSSNSAWLKEHNTAYIMHPMQDPKALRDQPPVIIESGDGVHITDVDGRRFIDCQGGLWCVNAGYGRKEIVEAVSQQMEKLAYYSLFPGSTNAPSIELSQKLIELTAQEGMAKVSFGLGGSDAVESALKIARQYWKLEGQGEKYKFISLYNGYHGLNFGGMSACGGIAWRSSYEPLMPGFIQVEGPHLYRNPFTNDPEELAEICAQIMERQIEMQGAHTVAAIIAEPIQGAGGVIVPPASYWPRLRQIADKHNVLLIADEVITGLGRSGALFGSRGWGVKPDIMCLAKGISSGYVPLSATLVNARVAKAWEKDAGFTSVYMHGYTYSGHPVSCAAGLAAIDIVVKENLAENARVVGDYFMAKLLELKDKHRAIGDVRGKGLMLAIELVKNRETKEPFGPGDAYPVAISEGCVSKGVMIRTIVNKLIISPPLTFTKEHVDEVVEALDKTFAANHW